MLYFRQVLILFVTLYTVRVVLDVLGVEDYGIYNVVGGIVSLLSFLSGTMASATQRFFSFALGQNDFIKLKKTFNVNVLIYVGIALIAIVFLETVGLWYVQTELNIPSGRLEAAKWIYQFSIFTFLTNILMSPFKAIIIAHEDMQIYAYVSIVEVILKLAVVFLLQYLSWDKLALYGMLILVSSFIITLIYIAICFRKYRECRFSVAYWDKTLFQEVVGFTGWTLFGQLTTVFRNQALTILLNQTFNPVIVAARAIAMNITSQINMFSNNFNVGLYPPIIKSYAAGDKKEMFSLIFNGSKFTFFLMWIFALPFFLEMDTILNIWLKNTPEYAVLFTRLALVESLIISISLPIATAARAPGKMKMYELILGAIQIGIFVAAWVVLKLGAAAYAVFVVAIIANLIMFVTRLLIVRGLIGMPLKPFFEKVLRPVFLIIVVSTTLTYGAKLILPEGFLFSGLCVVFSIVVTAVSIYFIGLDISNREKVRSFIKRKISIL